MLQRYSRPEMRAIWTEENKFKAWLEVELCACEAWVELGIIPREDVVALREKATFDIDRINEIELETRHDVIAFTRAVSETVGPERKWVHYGLTSTDVVDTAMGYLLLQANEILEKDIENFIEILRGQAVAYKDTAMMGRTHGVHAEPTTFGLKLALWYEEMKRNLERFRHAANGVQFGKISGAVGTYANIDPFVEEFTCRKLGITPAPISTQTLQRDRHAEYMATLALVATSLDKFATEIRALQKSEFREVEEPFAKGQKGSSAMPHKRNPIGCENISGLSRVIRGHMLTAYENVTLWHERDISHSSAERIILPDATMLLNYMLNRLGNILKNLQVFPENMKRNMQRTFGVPFSGRVMTKLIDKGFSREQAYDTVQPRAMQAWEEQRQFRDIIESTPEITSQLSADEIADCFNPAWHLKHVDTIFKRLELI
ncbi:adenylosuccinate lyase [Paenibacillus sacheonensis]|uniref:Adenylosuccinate lyase n=1 Tax=Paenibacillus sacheonensis TaxID=742054 RepID=A0A7X4YUN6_9BACL|nr:adenylosuccinate lyase [Paenibacillus sacheonensis]NBC72926.1 adenylosuccinate lyase [Paenibacillus sacheonensis]